MENATLKVQDTSPHLIPIGQRAPERAGQRSSGAGDSLPGEPASVHPGQPQPGGSAARPHPRGLCAAPARRTPGGKNARALSLRGISSQFFPSP